MNQASSASWISRLAAHPLLISLLLFVMALALRLLALGRYVTPDELIWVYRSVLFREAILAGRWTETLVAGHPGVTTTWLGTAALSLQTALRSADQDVYTWITQLAYLTPDNMAAFQKLAVFLDSGRAAVALVNSAGVVAVYWLARELLGRRVALIAAALLALDPFLGGLSGLFHVDGLLATWSILSILALALGIGLGRTKKDGRRQVIWLALSGAAAALALLSKSPALLLLPLAGVALLSLLWREKDLSFGRRLAMTAGHGAVWAGAFALVLLLLYPALWSSPSTVFATSGGSAGRHVEEALRPTFFMGDVSFDHGPLFYPIALLWRLSPLVIGGLLLLPLLFLWQRPPRGREAVTVMLLLAWVLLFIAGITMAAKKFDRYMLPVVPALALLAAVALAGAGGKKSRSLKLVILLMALAQGLMLLSSAPYLLSAYNPLLGGPFTAQYILPLGWGEGVSAGGRWLADSPDAESRTAVSGIAPSLAPFFPGLTLFAETTGPHQADYVILTANSRQEDPLLVERADEELQKLHTIRFGLLDQAWVYRDPQAQPLKIEAEALPDPPSFGEQMQLLAQDVRIADDGQELLFTGRWRKERADPLLLVSMQIQDEQGIVWQELEADLLNEVYFYPQHWQPGETPQVTYRLALPPAMPPGEYCVALSLIDRKTGGLLPVRSSEQQGGVIYEAGGVQLDLPDEAPDPARLGMNPVEDPAWLDGRLRLLGISPYLSAVQSGGVIELELFWQASGDLPPGLQVGILVDGAQTAVSPLSSFDSGSWHPGTILRQRYLVPVPAELGSGDYGLSAELLDREGNALSSRPASLGNIQVQEVSRLFTLPDDIAVPLAVHFEPGIHLRGVSPQAISASGGDAVNLTLYWQAETATPEPITAFLHVLDANDEIVAQADRWPGGLPSNVWSPNQVIIDEYVLELPADLPFGDYRIVTGLYTAGDGVRLPAFDSEGERLAGDRLLLPFMMRVTE